VTQTYLSSKATTAPFVPREASAAGWLRSNAVIVQVGPGMDIPSKGAQLRGDSNDLAVEMMRRIDSRRPSSKR